MTLQKIVQYSSRRSCRGSLPDLRIAGRRYRFLHRVFAVLGFRNPSTAVCGTAGFFNLSDKSTAEKVSHAVNKIESILAPDFQEVKVQNPVLKTLRPEEVNVISLLSRVMDIYTYFAE
jgi:hypothetical protein